MFSYGDLATFIAASTLFPGYKLVLVSTERYQLDPILISYFNIEYIVV